MSTLFNETTFMRWARDCAARLGTETEYERVLNLKIFLEHVSTGPLARGLPAYMTAAYVTLKIIVNMRLEELSEDHTI